ncbi:hypothetical protein [Acetobacter pasteurianus]|uniref:hypothetical protein n=1 Tax=Acetobacter pasteurianus TaxID=438 RepID=UPI003D0C5F00
MAVSKASNVNSLAGLEDALSHMGANPEELAQIFGNLAQQEPKIPVLNELGSQLPYALPSSLSNLPEGSLASPDESGVTNKSTASDISAGSGANKVTITNTSKHDETIGMFLNGGSTTEPVAKITLKPGESGTLSYANGQGGFMAKADSSGTFQPTASRLEFYADAKGVNNTDVSYIDGRNASIHVSDDQGKTAGDTKSIAASAPEGTITRDSAGDATIAGWYDGSSSTMQAGGAYMEQQLGTGNAYIHPDDDQKQADGTNPMTMAQDSSQNYTASFGDA